MALFQEDKNQDTILFRKVSSTDTLHSYARKSISGKSLIQNEVVTNDTTLVCKRNSIADVTFYDSLSFVRTPGQFKTTAPIYNIASQAQQFSSERKESLIIHLKEGNLLHHSEGTDWILMILLFSSVLLSLVRPFSKNFQSALRFMFFRGIKDTEYGESGGLFHWQTTIQNFISFSVIALFIYHAVSFFGGSSPMKGVIFWSLATASVIAAFTVRYIVCFVAGNLSGEREAFREYLTGIYQSYHIGALFLFIIVVLVSYTKIAPAGGLLITGFIWIGLVYILRVLRLLIIFINRNISVFYLILYLCALEILPVAIAIRYFSGTV
ncbi:MAG TPA: DUF4271 domain-containing protein [Bacteroidales bacterium]|nr:DUF4271 domain-containing protein [Bacteroidales bacterium]